jgi:hypothetical protein
MSIRSVFGVVVMMEQVSMALPSGLRHESLDLLWADGEDLRHMPLTDRKLRLRSVVPQRGERLLYCGHVDGDGEKLFTFAGVDQLFYSARSTLFEPQS